MRAQGDPRAVRRSRRHARRADRCGRRRRPGRLRRRHGVGRAARRVRACCASTRDERRIVGEVRVSGTPRDLAADGRRPVGQRDLAARDRGRACAPMQRGPGAAPDAVVVADLPLRSNGRSPIAPMRQRHRSRRLARHGYRAGSHRVGLLVCDDSTAQRGTYDAAKCRANARAYAADRRVVAEIGPYNSPCAQRAAADRRRGAGRPAGDRLADEHRPAAEPARQRASRSARTRAWSPPTTAQAQMAARFLRAAVTGGFSSSTTATSTASTPRATSPAAARSARAARGRPRDLAGRGRRPRSSGACGRGRPTSSTSAACSTTAPGASCARCAARWGRA